MTTCRARAISQFANALSFICSASACDESRVTPDTMVGRQLEWVLEAINVRKGAIEEPELREHFSPAFLEAGPVAVRQATLQFFALDMAPLTPLEIEAEASETQLRATLDGLFVHVRVSIDLDPVTGLMNDLQLAEQPDFGEGVPTSWEAVESTLVSLGARPSYLVARADDGRCEPLQGLHFEERLAIGTTSNLYVLAALAHSIEAGSLAWDDAVVLRDALKSPPPGQLRNLPEGTEVSVLELATQMISRADGTATDHLIDLLGRETVEASQSAAGHGAPELNTPFLSTREFNLLKLNLAEAEVEAYLASDAAAKRAILDSLAGRPAVRGFVPETLIPRRIDQIEWFASASELCALMLHLDTVADAPGLSEIRDVLSITTYLDIDRGAFPSVAYQGGAEAGVRHMSWLLRDPQGERHFVSVGVNDPDVWVPMYLYLTVPLGMFELLTPR
jgi:beta-lactamase class A